MKALIRLSEIDSVSIDNVVTDSGNFLKMIWNYFLAKVESDDFGTSKEHLSSLFSLAYAQLPMQYLVTLSTSASVAELSR